MNRLRWRWWFKMAALFKRIRTSLRKGSRGKQEEWFQTSKTMATSTLTSPTTTTNRSPQSSRNLQNPHCLTSLEIEPLPKRCQHGQRRHCPLPCLHHPRPVRVRHSSSTHLTIISNSSHHCSPATPRLLPSHANPPRDAALAETPPRLLPPRHRRRH